MSTYKNVNDNYTITCADGLGIFTVNAANIRFNGNITTTGSNTTIYDFITVAANNTGSVKEMGLLGQTGNTTFAGLQFNVNTNSWQISPSVTVTGAPIVAYANILTSSSPAVAAGSDTQLQFNQGGVFGASANLTYDYSNSRLTLNGYQVLGNTATPPNVANSVALYSNVVGSGGTGLYFTSTSAADELVSKSKAIVYAIIF
jgi:hypothetical protein